MTFCNKIITYNVNGIRDHVKRKCIFNHLHHLQANIILLQETHSDKKSKKLWKSEWGSSIIFSHGTSNARGLAMLFKRTSKHKIVKTAKDDEGRVLVVEILVNDRQYIIANLYAPNSDTPKFFEKAFAIIKSLNVDLQIIGGDFNTVLSLEKDIKGGKGHSNNKTRDFINNKRQEAQLVDIW